MGGSARWALNSAWHTLPKPVLLELSVQRAFADPQELGRLLTVARRHRQGLADRLLFQPVQTHAGQAAHAGRILRPVRPNIVPRKNQVD